MHKDKLLKKISENISEVAGYSSFSEYSAAILIKDLYRQGRAKSAQKVLENYETRFGKSSLLSELVARCEIRKP